MDHYALLAALEDARVFRGGGVPLAWSDLAEEIGTHAATFSRLKQGRLPGPRTLRAILEWLEMGPDEFAVTGDVSLPIGERDTPWDGEAATNRVFEWATNAAGDLEPGKLRRAFFYVDPSQDPLTRQAYKLPFCDVRANALQIIPRGMSAVAGGHGVDSISGASAAEKTAIKNKICSIYRRIVDKYDDWPDCPFDSDGTRPERRERRNDKDGDGVELKDYPAETRERMAKEGTAMPDGSYPIADCDDLKNAIQAIGRAKDPAATKRHIKKRASALKCDIELPDDWDLNEEEQPVKDDKKTAGIIGKGALSQSEDPHIQSLVARVQELLREGAVAVSIKHDLHPDASEAIANLAASEDPDMAEMQRLTEEAEIRPRHVAIVDTAAFSNARLTLGEDGYAVEGPVTFEGIYTGDVRTLRYGSLTWDDDLLPIPIIWDRDDNDHDGCVVGYISELERVDGMTTAVRPEKVSEEDVEAVTAAAGSSPLDSYFAKFKPTALQPLIVGDEDEHGLRRLHGHVAPFGVCHRSDMGACFQYPKDVDPHHRGFHTGQSITLSDGSTIRLGALTIGGRHVDTNLAKQGVGIFDVGRHRDDANTIFAVIRAWEDQFGLAVSGIVMPSVDQETLLRAMACSPSVELWPSGRGRTLVGVHLVPTPAWPVAASAGDAEIITEPVSVQVINPEGGFCEECGQEHDLASSSVALFREEWMGGVEASLKRIESALALLASDALTDVPMPEGDSEA